MQLLGGSVALLKGAAAIDAYRLVAEDVHVVRRRDGIEPSARQARRLAPSLGGQKKRSGEWVLDLGLVSAYLDHASTDAAQRSS